MRTWMKMKVPRRNGERRHGTGSVTQRDAGGRSVRRRFTLLFSCVSPLFCSSVVGDNSICVSTERARSRWLRSRCPFHSIPIIAHSIVRDATRRDDAHESEQKKQHSP